MISLETHEYNQAPIQSRKEILGIRKNRLFTLTGTLLFKRFVPYIPGRQIRGCNEESLKNGLSHIDNYESFHWLSFTVITGVSIFALLTGKPNAALLYSLINIPTNIYPLLLQRYNRLRFNHALDRYRRLKANNAKSFPPSPEEL